MSDMITLDGIRMLLIVGAAIAIILTITVKR